MAFWPSLLQPSKHITVSDLETCLSRVVHVPHIVFAALHITNCDFVNVLATKSQLWKLTQKNARRGGFT